jgi:hypothetical protein
MTTRQPLTEAEKAYLTLRHKAGATYRVIAQELACGYETVRKQAQRQRTGQAARSREVQGVSRAALAGV